MMVISLSGRKASGKSCLLFSASFNTWMNHPHRRHLLLPLIQLSLLQQRRLIISKALVNQTLVMQDQSEVIQAPIRLLFEASNMDALLLLLEHGVFQPLADKLLNAKELFASFPYYLCRPSGQDIPTPRMVRLLMPSRVAVNELCSPQFRVIDVPGMFDQHPIQQPMFHSFSYQSNLPNTTCAFVIGFTKTLVGFCKNSAGSFSMFR
jgi:hypothetical protein